MLECKNQSLESLRHCEGRGREREEKKNGLGRRKETRVSTGVLGSSVVEDRAGASDRVEPRGRDTQQERDTDRQGSGDRERVKKRTQRDWQTHKENGPERKREKKRLRTCSRPPPATRGASDPCPVTDQSRDKTPASRCAIPLSTAQPNRRAPLLRLPLLLLLHPPQTRFVPVRKAGRRVHPSRHAHGRA
ncbi:unnamed protein product [Scytosiphon promiscuus]